ncbi:MAG TPA: hypothetical protein VFZ09_50280 [Archangium sp.]|uniref:hypothetical protein n=1 Tax=Archangium sp. TaxID=1872627 RepID=UPI002E36EE4A|nr:hypothetical protein [Archangium sp.]HEX5754473.1 hypothetical protein [Archangium sp.]
MNRITIAVLLLSAATGCGTSRSATGSAREGNGTVTGIITLADEVGPKTGDFCAGLDVRVTPTGAPQEVLGDRMVRVSRGRCSYQVANLPAGSEPLAFSVKPPPAWQCANGATPTVTPEPRELTLRDYQTETRDFRVSCTAPSAGTSTATP